MQWMPGILVALSAPGTIKIALHFKFELENCLELVQH